MGTTGTFAGGDVRCTTVTDEKLKEMAREWLEDCNAIGCSPLPSRESVVRFAKRVRDGARAERDAEWGESIRGLQKRKAHNRDKAESMGRRNVASHRQSDVETCAEILRRMWVPRG